MKYAWLWGALIGAVIGVAFLALMQLTLPLQGGELAVMAFVFSVPCSLFGLIGGLVVSRRGAARTCKKCGRRMSVWADDVLSGLRVCRRCQREEEAARKEAAEAATRCPACGTVFAVRVKPGTYELRTTGLLGLDPEYGHSFQAERFCPCCIKTPCYAAGCNKAANVALLHEVFVYRPTKYSKTLTVRNDLCLCDRHASLIRRYRRGPIVFSHIMKWVGNVALPVAGVGAIWGFSANWPRNAGLTVALASSAMIVGFSVHKLTERLFETRKKPQFTLIALRDGRQLQDEGVGGGVYL